MIRDIRNHFEHEEEDYYKPVRVGNFCSNSYIEYESNGDRNKVLSIEEYLNKIRAYLKDIINDLNRDLEGRRMRIVQIYVCVLVYFLLKASAFDVPS